MGVPVFVTGAILDEVYDPDSNVFKWGDRFRDDGGREFILCKFNNGVDNIDAVIGHVICQMDSAYDKFEGTSDHNDPDCLAQLPLGAMQVAPADGKGVWCQYKGWNKEIVQGKGLTAQNVPATVSVSTNGALISKTAAAETQVGIPNQGETGNALAAGAFYFNIPI